MKMGRTIQQTEEKPRERRRQRDGAMGALNQRLGMPPSVDNHPNFTFRWYNDEGTRLSKAISNDYDFVDSSGEVVDTRSGNRFSVHVGSLPDGKPLIAYLMRKQADWYKEDKNITQTGIDEKMKKIQHAANSARAKPTGLNIQIS